MSEDLAAKQAKLGRLYEAITRAKDCLAREKSPDAALSLQDLWRQVKALRETFPKPRLAYDINDTDAAAAA